MTPIVCHNNYHIGDAMITAHLLRSLAKKQSDRTFWFFLHANILPSISEVVEDLKNIELFSFESVQWAQEKHRSVDTWKNFQDHWVKSKNRWNWVEHTLEHHDWTAKRMGCVSDFTRAEHLLFDYPALNPNGVGGMYFYDFLVVNSEPGSGQFGPMKQHGSGYLDDLVKRLARKNSVITTHPVAGIECTLDCKRSVTDIGNLSLFCRHHVMVATGPMWGTLNTTNHHYSAGRRRIALLDNGENLGIPNIQQAAVVEEVEYVLRAEGLL